MKSRIYDPQKAKQLIDFEGLQVDGYIYPTDIDGIIEYKDSEYIIFEVKYGDSELPFGQRLALQRMVDDFTKIGKQAVVFVCEHHVDDVNESVIVSQCKVREIYYGGKKGWRCPNVELTVRDAVDMFQEHSQSIHNSTIRR